MSAHNSKWRLAGLLVAGILCLHSVFFISLRKPIEQGYPDFTVFYTAAKILRNGLGHQLYVGHTQYEVQTGFTGHLPSRLGPLPYIHPPFEALIFVPLTLLPYRQAYLIWDLLNLAALFGVALLLREGVSALRLILPWGFVVVALAFFPVFECVLQGQDSILQLLFCTLAWRALQKEADVTAGCWFAFGAFKFQLMLPIVLLIVIWKGRRVLIGFAAVSSLLALISVWLVGWEGLRQYPVYALRIANTPSLGGVPADFLPNLHGLIMGWPLRFSGTLGAAIIGLSSAFLFLFVAIRGRLAADLGKCNLQFPLAIAISELIGWQTNIHDFSLLVLPLVLVADRCLRIPTPFLRERFSLLLPVLPLMISPLWFVFWFFTGTVNLMAIPLLWWVWKLSQELSSDLHPDRCLSVLDAGGYHAG
jgi:glycosyl transferase family 87